jgi:outer membrane protein OmpA-like peptidoglycan-associated protein
MRMRFLAMLFLLCAPLPWSCASAQGDGAGAPTAPFKERMRIFFAAGSSDISAHGLATIRRVVEVARELDALSIKIVGHADRIGIAADNERLAQERAQNVAAAIKNAQVPDGALSPVESRGSTEPFTTDRNALHLNRRVEISIYGIPRL